MGWDAWNFPERRNRGDLLGKIGVSVGVRTMRHQFRPVEGGMDRKSNNERDVLIRRDFRVMEKSGERKIPRNP